MCEPVTISTTAMWVMGSLAAASAAYGVYSYNQQKKSIKEVAKAQQDQIDAQAQQRTQDRMEEARRLRAQARAASAEAGVGGNSVDALLNDITGQAGRDAALIETNRKNGVAASSAEANARLRSAHAEMIGNTVQSASSFGGNYAQYTIKD